MTAKISIVASSTESVSLVARHLPTPDSSTKVAPLTGGARVLLAEIEKNHPDIVVAEIPRLTDDELRAVSVALLGAPTTSLILISTERSPEYLLKLMRCGAREVVLTPLAGDDLGLAYKRQIARAVALRGPARDSKVIAFVPAKGGSGATFLATNLGYALAQLGKRVALLDLNLHFGDAAIFVSDARPAQTIADLAREIDRVDATYLEATMLKVAPEYWLLAAPESPELAMDITPEAVERIIRVASDSYDFVIIDMGRILESVSVRALDFANVINIVLQPTLPFVHDAKRLVAMIDKLGYARDRLRLVVNRYEKGGEITNADIETSVGLKVALTVPNSFQAVAYSINHGTPVLRHAPRDVVSKAIMGFASSLAPKSGRSGGWLRIFGGGK